MLWADRVLADVGTPLIWATGGHLLIGNLFIGIFEGWLLSRLFGFKPVSSIIWMIIANYVSFIAGAMAIQKFSSLVDQYYSNVPPIFRLRSTLLTFAAMSYIASIVIEWPFCYLIAGKPLRRWRRSFLASVCAQSASYAILIVLYGFVTTTTMATVPDFQQDLSFVKDPTAWVYYIDPNDGAVWRIHLNGRGREMFAETNLPDLNARLYAERSATTNSGLRLAAIAGMRDQNPRIVKNSFASVAAPQPGEAGNPPITWSSFDSWGGIESWGGPGGQLEHDLRGKDQREWTCCTGQWASEGILVSHNHKQEYRLAYATPFSSEGEWTCRNCITLSGDQAVFQVNDQILILDLPSRKLGFLTYGRGPVVALD